MSEYTLAAYLWSTLGAVGLVAPMLVTATREVAHRALGKAFCG